MAQDAAGAIGGMFKKAGQYVSDKYAAGARAQASKQVQDRLKGLADAMLALGINQQDVDSTLKMVKNIVAAGGVQPEMTRAGASRQGRKDYINRIKRMRNAQTAQTAQTAQPQQQAQNPWAAGLAQMQQQKPSDPYSAFRSQAG
jgi:myosin heavy subunit